MNTKQYLFVALIPCAMTIVNTAYAVGCEDYPFVAGDISFEDTPSGPKILATGAATVDFDDEDEVLDAITEAEMEAKAIISKFFTETIQSDQRIETATKKNIKIVSSPSGDQKAGSKEKMKLALKSLSSHSTSLLRGVVKLAECYTKGKRVMVSVGLKPETIAAAATATETIATSIAKTPTTTKQTTKESATSTDAAGQQGKPTGGTKSYSKGLEKLKKF